VHWFAMVAAVLGNFIEAYTQNSATS